MTESRSQVNDCRGSSGDPVGHASMLRLHKLDDRHVPDESDFTIEPPATELRPIFSAEGFHKLTVQQADKEFEGVLVVWNYGVPACRTTGENSTAVLVEGYTHGIGHVGNQKLGL